MILFERLKVAKSTDEENAASEKNLIVALAEQNMLENIAKIEEVKVRDLELQIVDFREESLTIKKEKKEIRLVM